MVAIMGSSGSGKSTLLNILGLLDGFDSGEYILSGESMAGLNERAASKYRSKFLGFVFQSFNLISFKTALENVALPLYYQSIPRKKRNIIAMEYLKKVGLEEWATHLPNQMSGGQKQRVAIARALVGKPKVILADEPTGALDSGTSKDVMKLLREINAEGITMIIVTHEHDIAALCDRTIHLVDGIID
jgi:putative ABC transport system ATP-binding protein